MWAVWIVGALFLVAIGCVTTALYKHDGPMWAAVFVALLVAALLIW